MYPEHAWWGGMWFFYIVMPIIMLACIFIFFYLFSGRAFFRSPWQDNYRSEQSDMESALDILKKRYAKGEINQKDYEQMKKDIS